MGLRSRRVRSHAGGERRRRQGGADDELGAAGTGLGCWIVDLPAGVAIDVLFVNVVDDADDVQVIFWIAGVVGDDLSDGIVVGPVGIGGKESRVRLVDHDDVFAVRTVGPGEVASAEARAHGAQIARGNDVDEGSGVELSGRLTPLGKGIPQARFWPRGR